MTVKQHSLLVDSLKALCLKAGDAILMIYSQDDIDVLQKNDDTPVTEADRKSHRIITDGLELLSREMPVLSEEGSQPPLTEREKWEKYWLVDPLDGTREFLARTDEFTINIALMEDNKPVLGMIYAPVAQSFYYGGLALQGSWRQVVGQTPVAIHTRSCAPGGLLNIAVSRYHGRGTLADLIGHLEQRFSEVHLTVAGSALKACLIAEGCLDIYPRRGPTHEWDTAAGQAIIEGAGGRVLNNKLLPLTYNRQETLINPDFYMIGDPNVAWAELLIPPA